MAPTGDKSDREIALITQAKLEQHFDEDARRFGEIKTELRDMRDEATRYRAEQSQRTSSIHVRMDEIEEKQDERHHENADKLMNIERGQNRAFRAAAVAIIGALLTALGSVAFYILTGRH